MDASEIAAACFLVGGSLFVMVGSLGVLNMPDLLCRAHALSKATTLGISLMLIGLWISLGSEEAGLKTFFGIVFQLATIPLSGNLIAHYFWHQETKLSSNSKPADEKKIQSKM